MIVMLLVFKATMEMGERKVDTGQFKMSHISLFLPRSAVFLSKYFSGFCRLLVNFQSSGRVGLIIFASNLHVFMEE